MTLGRKIFPQQYRRSINCNGKYSLTYIKIKSKNFCSSKSPLCVEKVIHQVEDVSNIYKRIVSRFIKNSYQTRGKKTCHPTVK